MVTILRQRMCFLHRSPIAQTLYNTVSRCSISSRNTMEFMHTESSRTAMLTTDLCHNHGPDTNLSRQVIANELIRRAIQDNGERPIKLVKQEISCTPFKHSDDISSRPPQIRIAYNHLEHASTNTGGGKQGCVTGRIPNRPSSRSKMPATANATTDAGTPSDSTGYALVYTEYGDPSVVLKKETFSVPTKLNSDEVLVKILAAPINPIDTRCVQGVYVTKTPLPGIGGFECVGKVIGVASDVTKIQLDDLVIPAKFDNGGTWRTHAVWKQNDLWKIPSNIPVLTAATIGINPCTAYLILHDFIKLQPGDVVIQNGANSAVGEAVIQIAHYLKVRTINVVRSRPNIEELKARLTKLGADHVVTEEEISNEEFRNSLPVKPILAFDCVGGQSSSVLLDSLVPGGTMVTYGSMSRQPVMAHVNNIMYKDIRLRGFWLIPWRRDKANTPEAVNMIDFLCKLIQEGRLAPPLFDEMQLDNHQAAVQKAMSDFKGVKVIFVMNEDTAVKHKL